MESNTNRERYTTLYTIVYLFMYIWIASKYTVVTNTNAFAITKFYAARFTLTCFLFTLQSLVFAIYLLPATIIIHRKL